MPMTANGLAKLLEELGELPWVTAKRLAYFHTSTHPDCAGDLGLPRCMQPEAPTGGFGVHSALLQENVQ